MAKDHRPNVKIGRFVLSIGVWNHGCVFFEGLGENLSQQLNRDAVDGRTKIRVVDDGVAGRCFVRGIDAQALVRMVPPKEHFGEVPASIPKLYWETAIVAVGVPRDDCTCLHVVVSFMEWQEYHSGRGVRSGFCVGIEL